MDEHEWQVQNAARLRQALQRPEVRAELLELLGADDADRRSRRRRAAARAELAGLEVRWRIEEDTDAWEA